MTLLRHSFWFCSVLLSIAQVQAQVSRNSAPAKVIMAPVTFEAQRSRIEAVGTAEAIRSVMIYPAAADKVTSVHFTPGQKVQRGEILLELDSRRQQVAYERAAIELADAERTVTRLQESRKRGAIAQSELDDAMTARDLMKVQLAAAQTELDDRKVIAPFSGVVGLTDVEAGDRITLQTAITTIDDRQQLFVHFNAPESAFSMLQGKAEVILEPWQSGGKTITAQIAQVDSRIDPQNRSLRVRALLDNPDDAYRPGMSFRVVLTLTGDEYAVVPEAALLWGATGAYVWLARDGKASKVDVSIAQRLTGRVLVSGDIRKGEQLIIEGVQNLRPNQAVAQLDSAE
ncbi:MAG TPA: efflux RND transporter periplasmic adaptor subunit [Rheinheimera sp.]|nr:efflux RND transporter periplasmic adaptor subunit [Rheinheimera sp.]